MYILYILYIFTCIIDDCYIFIYKQPVKQDYKTTSITTKNYISKTII